MDCNVNGWSTIARHLERTNKRQGELAHLLKVSPAAITQIKNGQFLLNPRQMQQIIQFFDFDENAISEFYTELFNARLCAEDIKNTKREPRFQVTNTMVPHRKDETSGNEIVPVINIAEIGGFEPALEPMTQYVRRNSAERLPEKGDDIGLCALRMDANHPEIHLPANSVIVLKSLHYPQPGNLCLLALNNGRLLLREFHPEGEKIYFRSAFEEINKELVWRKADSPGLLSWIFPVKEIIIKLNT